MPKVNKKILIIIAGVLWTGVGIMLIRIAFSWLIKYSGVNIIGISVAGVSAGILISKFAFNNIAEKNINRIKQYDKKICLFAFQNIRSYFLIIIMIFLGILLKSASYIPDKLLSLIYISIGSGLFIASYRYLIALIKCLKLKK